MDDPRVTPAGGFGDELKSLTEEREAITQRWANIRAARGLPDVVPYVTNGTDPLVLRLAADHEDLLRREAALMARMKDAYL